MQKQGESFEQRRLTTLTPKPLFFYFPLSLRHIVRCFVVKFPDINYKRDYVSTVFKCPCEKIKFIRQTFSPTAIVPAVVWYFSRSSRTLTVSRIARGGGICFTFHRIQNMIVLNRNSKLQ